MGTFRIGGQPVILTRADHLTPADVDDVLALTHAAGDADGAYPLSEHVVLHLRRGGDTPARHVLMRADTELVGYAHVDPTDQVAGASAELCVHPLHRRHGLGRMLVNQAIDIAAGQRLRLWAHGDHPSANALALSLGFDRARVLFQMRRSLFAPVPAPNLPEGVRLRPFRPGVDDEAWLRLNGRAFAAHPDQGRWTQADLQARLAESWFDPTGFLLAERNNDGALLGFHWTKVHGTQRGAAAEHHAGAQVPGSGAEHDHDPIGEVYVLGVDPDARGLHLGVALTLAGLRHLREDGLDQVMLYVDESNHRAIALYQRLDFARWSTDVCFVREASPRTDTTPRTDAPPPD